MSNNTKLLCLFLRAQKINKSSEQGYAMAMVSMVSIIMLSLLAASMTFSNLAKSRTDAFVDSSSAFSVAESGLNRRAVEFKAKLDTYSGVREISDLTGSRTLAECFDGEDSPLTDSLGCRNYSFQSRTKKSTFSSTNNGYATSNIESEAVNEYIAYTAISQTSPQLVSVSDGDYAGLNAVEYKYTLSAAAKKPVNSETTPVGNASKSSNNINLSMTFTNRVVSLFQFAIFYNGDLEFNSTTPMQVQGRVHSNANIYAQPAGENTALSPSTNSITTFLSKVSAVGSIYNRVDAWTPGIGRTGITRVLLTGSSCPGSEVITLPSSSNCKDISGYASATDPLDSLGSTEIDTFSRKLAAGIPTLTTPAPGFPRKRNYATNAIGEYYAKADMRLDFVPDRDITSKTTAPWTRETGIIPFNFTAMTTTGTGTCSTTAPTAGTDPDANYVDPKREGLSTLKCNKLTKGQLQSLRQPVMVLTELNNNAQSTRENTTLRVSQPARPTPPSLNTLSTPELTITRNNKILRALQVAIVSNPKPISLDQLDQRLDTDPSLLAVKDEFIRLLDIMLPVPTTGVLTPAQEADKINKQNLVAASPNKIAALRDAWFLPAPIQRVETGTVQDAANTRTATTTTPPSSPNPSSSGFYDGREQRWISVLQTNIASLSVWNRDGLYVTANDETMTSAYTASTTNRTLAFADATTANYSASGLAFDRVAADSTKPVGSLQYLGLGSIDSTEGGLIIHASVNDDLDGNGGAINATNDIAKDTASPIYKKNPDNTDYQDLSLPDETVDKRVILDYYRKYPGITATKKSPFAFAFNGGDYLPNNLMLTSDQAIYVQGNFNNNGNTIAASGASTSSGDRLSASVVADTITVLSNNCISLTPSSANTGVPTGQLNCGIKDGANSVGQSMVINAAFLSNTDVSNGNLGDGRGYQATDKTGNRYSGGVNNYIRLLEDWNNAGSPRTLNYMGSMISLGAPLEYSGQYRSGGDVASATGVTPVVIASYYNVPFRNFSYDQNFNSVDKMPPLTPKASYVQQKNFSRVY
jgi:Tfp pilus assembly protein PilX